MIYLLTPYRAGYRMLTKGPVAQLGERYNRTVEVMGSNPFRSTDLTQSEHPLAAAIMPLFSFPAPLANLPFHHRSVQPRSLLDEAQSR